MVESLYFIVLIGLFIALFIGLAYTEVMTEKTHSDYSLVRDSDELLGLIVVIVFWPLSLIALAVFVITWLVFKVVELAFNAMKAIIRLIIK